MEKQIKGPLEVKIPECGIWISSYIHDKEFSMDKHSSNHLELFFIRGGTGKLITDAGEWKFKKNHLFMIPPNTPHKVLDDYKAPVSHYKADFKIEILAKHKDDRQIIDKFTKKSVHSNLYCFAMIS